MEAGTTAGSSQFGSITGITGDGSAVLTAANATANSNGSYGSLWTSDGLGGYTLMPQGSTWNDILATTDGAGNLSFQMTTLSGSGPYFAGFQITPVPEPGTVTIFLGSVGMLAFVRRIRC